MASFRSFKKLAGYLWKANFERAGINSTFNPVFYKVIGVEDSDDYNAVLKFLVNKAENFLGAVFFASEVPTSPDFDLIQYLSAELENMNLKDLKHADIVLFSDSNVNFHFLDSLQTIVDLYEAGNSFINKSVKIDFITKLILWTYTYLKPIENTFEESVCPKCFYYGDISKHEAYFLLLVYFMGIDVLYINPLKDSLAHLPKLEFIQEIIYQQISQIGNIMDRISNALDINLETSTTAQLMDEIQEEIFTNGVYRPWQLKDFKITPCKKQFTIYDLKNNIAEPAKVRDGFRVDGNVVTSPNMFFQIDGVPDDLNEYSELINLIIKQPFTTVLEFANTLLQRTLADEKILQLLFCRIGDCMYDINELRKLPFYRWKGYSSHVERKLIDGINRTLSDGIFRDPLPDKEEFRFVGDILSISEEIIKGLDNYDYSDKIPKLFIFLNNEDFLYERLIRVICFVYELGFDVIIMNPSGLKSIGSIVTEGVYSHIRYDKMVYDMTFSQATEKKKAKGFFSRLFQ